MNNTRAILPAVAAIIFNEKGEVLLQRRKDVNQWCIISGHVEFGESISEAMLREIQEETGLEASIVRFIGLYSSPSSQTYCYGERTVQYVTAYFEAALSGSLNPHLFNDETIELRYFSPAALPDDLAQLNPYWLEDALNKNEAPFIR
jgi:8-oxo-dGTP diphosphatase